MGLSLGFELFCSVENGTETASCTLPLSVLHRYLSAVVLVWELGMETGMGGYYLPLFSTLNLTLALFL